MLYFTLYGRKDSVLAAYGLTYLIITLPVDFCYLRLYFLTIVGLTYGVPMDFGLKFPLLWVVSSGINDTLTQLNYYKTYRDLG